MAAAAIPNSALAEKASYKPARIDFNDDGSQYIRFITWHQIWTRAIQNNPRTLIQGDTDEWSFDVGIRRSRFLVVGQPIPEVQILTHVGINNQTFSNQRKPQVFVHDAWVQYRLHDEKIQDTDQSLSLYAGFGLHYWHGISRMTNASTLNLMTIDVPILNFPTIERSDQFARMLGAYLKGKVYALDYRFAINRPFVNEVTDAGLQFNPTSASPAYAGYINWQFLDQESNAVPYTVGSYLGKKRVFNVGAGFHIHPKGMATFDATPAITDENDIVLLGADVFADFPIGDAGAFTGYFAYYHYDFGDDFVRSFGIMNLGTPTATSNTLGAGNAYPIIGTGEHFYLQAGYLLPLQIMLQPYVATQLSLMDALDDPMALFEVGLNWFLGGHHAKLTLHYRNRPVFITDARPFPEDTRRSEIILQTHVYF